MKPLRLKTAWIVTWVGSNTHSKQLVAVLDYRLSTESVAEFVERLHMTLRYTPEEQLRYTKSPKDNPYRAVRHQFQKVTCGHNPLLFARIASDLRMEGDRLKWTEPPDEAKMRKGLKEAGLLR